ncbi:hypothetical protein HPP92_010780 [Vanilla planifolia]|uniref:Uncharacterized protein n=1 Tax=Vanilla planifolia TaxID=51239 RepID=A0A835V4E5_VANPL|nr:hypothetical protein HPP92_011032 [Vanilla planifolia]KAG0482696.1 hypothetical protein HPP92_010780 [Vanilla planifolia]
MPSAIDKWRRWRPETMSPAAGNSSEATLECKEGHQQKLGQASTLRHNHI